MANSVGATTVANNVADDNTNIDAIDAADVVDTNAADDNTNIAAFAAAGLTLIQSDLQKEQNSGSRRAEASSHDCLRLGLDF